MGSRFSVLNDTQHKVWIKHGINWKVLTAVFRGIAFLFNKGMACAATRSSNKVEPEERITNDVVTAGDESLRNASEAAEKVQDDDEGFKADAELIEPGEKYTFSGTLSLTMTVYVMNDKQQVDRRACFTGPTHDSENRYPISQYFPKLAVN